MRGPCVWGKIYIINKLDSLKCGLENDDELFFSFFLLFMCGLRSNINKNQWPHRQDKWKKIGKRPTNKEM